MSDLAVARGVSRQVVAANIKRWRAHGADIPVKGQGRTLLVNAEAYDRFRGDYCFSTTSREPGSLQRTRHRGRHDMVLVDDKWISIAAAQMLKENYLAQLARLEYEERRRKAGGAA